MKPRDVADTIGRAVFGFDPTQGETRALDLAAQVAQFMIEERSWIYSRPVSNELTNALLSNNFVVLHGEAGCGKTTILRSIGQNVGQDPDDLPPTVVIDFNHATAALAAAETKAKKRRKVLNLVFGPLKAALESQISANESAQVRRYRRIHSADEFEAFRDLLGLRGIRVEECEDPAVLDNLLLDEKLDAAHEQALERYRKDVDLLEREIAHADVATSLGAHAILALDNLDPLDPVSRGCVAEVAAQAFMLNTHRLPVAIACRSEHVDEMTASIDKAANTPLSAVPVAVENRPWDISDIVIRRVRLMQAANFRMTIRGAFPKGIHAMQTYDQLDSVVARVSRMLKTLQQERAPIPGGPSLAKVLTSWHNGNIRAICTSIYTLTASEVAGPDPRHIPASNTTDRRMTNQVYRHILLDSSFEGVYGRTLTSRPLSLFQAKPEMLEQDLPPFYFLRFRALRLLIQHKRMTVRAAVRRLSSTYGVDPKIAHDALLWLSDQQANGRLVRFESKRGEVQAPSIGSDARSYVLEAGRFLGLELVFTVEYMYWSSLDVNARRDRIELLATTLNSRLDTPTVELKVHAAIDYLVEYLLPRFCEEHPYMVQGHGHDDADRKRLRAFRHDFGFDQENWFIDRARASILAHASKTGVPIRASFMDQLDSIEGMSDRLNSILKP